MNVIILNVYYFLSKQRKVDQVPCASYMIVSLSVSKKRPESVGDKNTPWGTEEMPQQLAAHAAFPEDLNFVSNTHVKQLTYNYSYKACVVLFWALQASSLCAHTHAQKQI